jgi:pyruvate,water dikinase
MAVLVQRMVPAVLSGVIFSIDPASPEPRIVVEAAPHSGSVVGGRIIPDRYFILPDGTIVNDLINDQKRPFLNESMVRELGRITRAIVNILGCPQDIEWVWDGGRFHILQARPITSLPEKHVYSRRMVAEMSPGVIKPLLWSTNVRDMNYNVFGKLFSQLTGKNDLDFTPMTRLIRSRVYADMTFIGNILTLTGLPENFFESIGRGEEANRPRFRLRLLFILNTLRCLPFFVRLMRPSDEIHGFLERHRARHTRQMKTDWSQHDPESILSNIYRQRKYHGETQWYMWITALNMSLRSRMLTRFVRRHIPGTDPNHLLVGMKDLMGIAPNREIERIALTARKLPETDLEQLSSREDAAIRAMLTPTETGRKILAKVDRFMRQYGFLSTSGTDFTVAPWSENPELIWRSIHHAAVSPKNTAVKNNRDARESEPDPFAHRLSSGKFILYKKLLTGTRKYISLRDKVSFAMARDSYIMRNMYLQLGSLLVGDGCLVLPEDIFYLYFDELTDLIQGKIPESRIKRRIVRRKKELAQDEQAVVPETITDSESIQTENPLSHKDQTCLNGIPGSPGMITGLARVVHAPAINGNRLSKDDILVVPFTDVGWTPLFSVIGGIVAETGGQLSHSSIIAREYRLPAVVGVRDATRLIRDGQEITVDGSSGKVYL